MWLCCRFLRSSEGGSPYKVQLTLQQLGGWEHPSSAQLKILYSLQSALLISSFSTSRDPWYPQFCICGCRFNQPWMVQNYSVYYWRISTYKWTNAVQTKCCSRVNCTTLCLENSHLTSMFSSLFWSLTTFLLPLTHTESSLTLVSFLMQGSFLLCQNLGQNGAPRSSFAL